MGHGERALPKLRPFPNKQDANTPRGWRPLRGSQPKQGAELAAPPFHHEHCPSPANLPQPQGLGCHGKGGSSPSQPSFRGQPAVTYVPGSTSPSPRLLSSLTPGCAFLPSRAAAGPSGGSRRPRSPQSRSTSSCSVRPGCRGRDGRHPPCGSKGGERVSSPPSPQQDGTHHDALLRQRCLSTAPSTTLPKPSRWKLGPVPYSTGVATLAQTHPTGCCSQDSIP